LGGIPAQGEINFLGQYFIALPGGSGDLSRALPAIPLPQLPFFLGVIAVVGGIAPGAPLMLPDRLLFSFLQHPELLVILGYGVRRLPDLFLLPSAVQHLLGVVRLRPPERKFLPLRLKGRGLLLVKG